MVTDYFQTRKSSNPNLIIYMSDYVGSKNQVNKELVKISSVAKVNNIQFNITGVLFYHNGKFLQAIEGTRTTLEHLMMVLEKDPRHKNITRLVDTEVNNQSFSDWNMDAFNLDDDMNMNAEQITEIKQLFDQQCQMDGWLFVQTLKDALLKMQLQDVNSSQYLQC